MPQTRHECRRTLAHQLTAAAPDQFLARHLQQRTGLVIGSQYLARQAQRQQAMPGTAKVLRTAVEGQHQLLRVALAEHTAFDIAGRQQQGREVVLGLGHDPFTGQVKHTNHLTLRVT
ncbi:hypothetical protein D3C77_631570 [compost metagenome]